MDTSRAAAIRLRAWANCSIDRRQAPDFRRADFTGGKSISAGLGGGNNYWPRVCSDRLAFDCGRGWRSDLGLEDGKFKMLVQVVTVALLIVSSVAGKPPVGNFGRPFPGY